MFRDSPQLDERLQNLTSQHVNISTNGRRRSAYRIFRLVWLYLKVVQPVDEQAKYRGFDIINSHVPSAFFVFENNPKILREVTEETGMDPELHNMATQSDLQVEKLLLSAI